MWRAPFILAPTDPDLPRQVLLDMPVSGFRFKRGKLLRNNRGRPLYIDGVLNLSKLNHYRHPDFRTDGGCRTVVGPSVAHNARIIGNTAENLSRGFMRLGGIRTDLATEIAYRRDQRIFIYKHSKELEYIRERYAMGFSEFTSTIEEAVKHAGDVHVKRELRIEALAYLMHSGLIGSNSWLTNEKVIYKMKKDEMAKVFKTARLIGDLKVPASLAGAWITKHMKYAMRDNVLRINGGKITFCAAPHTAALRTTMGEIRDPEGKFTFTCFSDDSCIGIRTTDGRVFQANLDISKCDGSHTERLFEALRDLFPASCRPEVQRLINQCKAKIRVSNPESHRRGRSERVDLTPKEAVLYSGSTLTTIINNLASYLIAIGISEEINSHPGRNTIESLMQTCKDGAARAGYLITVEQPVWTHEPQAPGELQFLKHSLAEDKQGRLQPVLNFGVFLRSSGICHGRLPRGDIKQIGTAFQSLLLRGMYPRTHCPLLDALRKSCNHKPVTEKVQRNLEAIIARKLAYKVDVALDEEDLYFTDDEFLRRYDLTEAEIAKLYEMTAGFGSHHHSTGAGKILKADYGLSLLQNVNIE